MMPSQTYEEFERDYASLLSRVRSFLASTRSRSTLLECERLLDKARKCAIAMQGLAEIEGNPIRVREAQQRTKRDIAPLSREIASSLGKVGNVTYQAPVDGDIEQQPLFGTHPTTTTTSGGMGELDTEQLISHSNELLLESQALCAESEQIGQETLGQMGQQREQLLSANRYVSHTHDLTMQARRILKDMRNKGLRNKTVLYSLIFALIIANGWALHHLFVKK